MEYLTTHDLVWINNSITGGASPYNYVTLESAMAGQYSYGQSQDVPAQAANLLSRLLFNRPFQTGNQRTALVATLAFLKANGYQTRVSDEQAAQIIQDVMTHTLTPTQAIADLAEPAGEALRDTTLRKLIMFECNTHPQALTLLAAGDQ